MFNWTKNSSILNVGYIVYIYVKKTYEQGLTEHGRSISSFINQDIF